MAEPARPLRITKMHGAGNDFVVLDLRDGAPPPDAALCRKLADRHVGVGCDQILTIEPPRSDGADAAYGIWNSDGSHARQCGNGARCVAAWLARDAGGERVLTLDSPSGTHRAEPLGGGRWRVAMGRPAFAPEAVPLHATPDGDGRYVLDLDGHAVRFGAVSMGNPHAVLAVDDVGAAAVERIGPALQRHAAFPQSVNVGFAEVVARGRIRLRVYERGAGETLACGSGACAAAAVLMREGRVDRRVVVQLPGGELEIEWPPDDDAPIAMAGPTAFVFDGRWLSS